MDKCPIAPEIETVDLANYMKFVVDMEKGPEAYLLEPGKVMRIARHFPDCEYCSVTMATYASTVSLAVRRREEIGYKEPPVRDSYEEVATIGEGIDDQIDFTAITALIRGRMRDPKKWFKHAMAVAEYLAAGFMPDYRVFLE